jgi:hypothetical protein
VSNSLAGLFGSFCKTSFLKFCAKGKNLDSSAKNQNEKFARVLRLLFKQKLCCHPAATYVGSPGRVGMPEKTPRKKIQGLVPWKGSQKNCVSPVFLQGKRQVGTYGEQCSSRGLSSRREKKPSTKKIDQTREPAGVDSTDRGG